MIDSLELRLCEFPPQAGHHPYNSLGTIYAKSGNHDMAIATYKHAVDLDPRNYIGLYNIAEAYSDSGDYANAISYYKRAVAVNPKMFDAWNDLGLAYGRSGSYEHAIGASREAVKASSSETERAEALYELAISYKLAGHQDRAMDTYYDLRSLDGRRAEKLFAFLNRK